MLLPNVPQCRLSLLAVLLCVISSYGGGVRCFVPADLLGKLIRGASTTLKGAFGEVSVSIVHEDILRRGIIRSVAKYFHDQPGGDQLIDVTRLERYYDLYSLYEAYYRVPFCVTRLGLLLELILEPNVAIVDFDADTKDLPHAHFDAETLVESNARVERIMAEIDAAISSVSYDRARRLAGQVMHTVQDFYSHTNWVEMGNVDRINALIGTRAFDQQSMVTRDGDPVTCYSNCELVEVRCSLFTQLGVDVLSALGLDSATTLCPLKYYKCADNLATRDKLLSGYYVNQKLADGTLVNKPVGAAKCSHGGILDKSGLEPAVGGINKDSGYYLLSPHAHLHLTAAELAIRHTEHFFDGLRLKHGDERFAKLLQLSEANSIGQIVQVCAAPGRLAVSAKLALVCLAAAACMLSFY